MPRQPGAAAGRTRTSTLQRAEKNDRRACLLRSLLEQIICSCLGALALAFMVVSVVHAIRPDTIGTLAVIVEPPQIVDYFGVCALARRRLNQHLERCGA